MPKMKLSRDFVLTTTLGHSIQFVKGQDTHVPQSVVAQALSIGAELITNSDKETVVAETIDIPNVKTRPADQRAYYDELIKAFKIMEAMDAEGKLERGAYTAAGQPSVLAVSNLVGYNTFSKDIAVAWAEYNASK